MANLYTRLNTNHSLSLDTGLWDGGGPVGWSRCVFTFVATCYTTHTSKLSSLLSFFRVSEDCVCHHLMDTKVQCNYILQDRLYKVQTELEGLKIEANAEVPLTASRGRLYMVAKLTLTVGKLMRNN